MREPQWVELSGREANAQWGLVEEADEYYSKLQLRWKKSINVGHEFNVEFRYRRFMIPPTTEEIHF